MEYTNPNIKMFLLSLKDFQSKELAESVISTINNFGNDFMPHVFDLYEPLKQKYSIDNVDDVVNLWLNDTVNEKYRARGEKLAAGQVLMARKKGHDLSYHISWEKGSQPRFNFFSINMGINYLKKGDNFNSFLELCKRLINVIEPVYGSITNCSYPNYMELLDLTVRLSDVQWGTIFGKPYIEMFTKEKVLSCPCSGVTELENTIFLQATQNIFEEVPKSEREVIKRHLGESAFVWDSKSIRYYTKQVNIVPKFDFSSVMFP